MGFSRMGFSLASQGQFNKSIAPVPLAVVKNVQNEAKQAALSVPANRSREPKLKPDLGAKNQNKLNQVLSSQITF